ncbi:MAG: hypothetical protein O7G86_19580 [Gammaproteobacteria bacterium]|nr:hypothetical protein [Gammaproteobacteria bacterium]
MNKLIVLFLFPVLACAEPNPAIKYLMDEPASLFDVGMFRLQHLIGYEEKQKDEQRATRELPVWRGGLSSSSSV